MPEAFKPIKAVLLGESGDGKSTALASLCNAGYNVRVLDLDNNIGSLVNVLRHSPKYSREAINRLAFITLTEPMGMTQGRIIPRKAFVWPEVMRMLEGWKNADAERGTVADLGKLTSWTSQEVLCIDTLSPLSQAALNFHLALQGQLGNVRTGNDGRRDVGGAQSLLRSFMQLLADDSIKCNIVLNCHIVYVKADGSGMLTPTENAPTRGLPNSIGRAFSPEIPRGFGSVLKIASLGAGTATKRIIYTTTQGNISLKTPAPYNVKPEYNQETGLAEYFADIRKAQQ